MVDLVESHLLNPIYIIVSFGPGAMWVHKSLSPTLQSLIIEFRVGL